MPGPADISALPRPTYPGRCCHDRPSNGQIIDPCVCVHHSMYHVDHTGRCFQAGCPCTVYVPAD